MVPVMSRRLKTLIATILIVFVWLPVYVLILIPLLAAHMLPGAPWYLSLLFYLITGVFWIVPIGLSLPWMYREPNSPCAAKPLAGGDAGPKRQRTDGSRAGEGRGGHKDQ
jgi:hypothetical protein